ncbi:MAG: RDD family protein [bacterium]|nr:RDD family protein [bacterium]
MTTSSDTRLAPPSGGAPDYAGFWVRFFAYFIDGAIFVVLALIAGFILGLFLPARVIEDSPEFNVLYALIAIIIPWPYMCLMESSSKQATLGKMALGIIVTDLGGNRISLARATGRSFGKVVSALILNIGFLMAGFTRRKQALHDIMAGCLVVYKAPDPKDEEPDSPPASPEAPSAFFSKKD